MNIPTPKKLYQEIEASECAHAFKNKRHVVSKLPTNPKKYIKIIRFLMLIRLPSPNGSS